MFFVESLVAIILVNLIFHYFRRRRFAIPSRLGCFACHKKFWTEKHYHIHYNREHHQR